MKFKVTYTNAIQYLLDVQADNESDAITAIKNMTQEQIEDALSGTPSSGISQRVFLEEVHENA